MFMTEFHKLFVFQANLSVPNFSRYIIYLCRLFTKPVTNRQAKFNIRKPLSLSRHTKVDLHQCVTPHASLINVYIEKYHFISKPVSRRYFTGNGGCFSELLNLILVGRFITSIIFRRRMSRGKKGENESDIQTWQLL